MGTVPAGALNYPLEVLLSGLFEIGIKFRIKFVIHTCQAYLIHRSSCHNLSTGLLKAASMHPLTTIVVGDARTGAIGEIFALHLRAFRSPYRKLKASPSRPIRKAGPQFPARSNCASKGSSGFWRGQHTCGTTSHALAESKNKHQISASN